MLSANAVVSLLLDSQVFPNVNAAAASVKEWKDWRSAGLEFSSFHNAAGAFSLPFRPGDYVWAGPFTVQLAPEALEMARKYREDGEDFQVGHFRRGVRK